MKKLVLTSAICALLYADATIASDLEIYSEANDDEGKTVLMIMLDKSGSMNSAIGRPSAKECGMYYIDRNGNVQGNAAYKKAHDETLPAHSFTVDGNAVNYTMAVQYKKCDKYPNVKYYTRLGALKKALFETFTSKRLKDEYIVGLGAYPVAYSVPKGQILVPAKSLDDKHRITILDAVKTMKDEGVTPFANAYAEAGAYMLGTNPLTSRVTEKTITKTKYTQLGFEKTISSSSTTVTITEDICKNELKGTWYSDFKDCGYTDSSGRFDYRKTYQKETSIYGLFKCNSVTTEPTGTDNDKYYDCVSSSEVDRKSEISQLNKSLIQYNAGNGKKQGNKYYKTEITTITEKIPSEDDYSGFVHSADNTKTITKDNYKKPPSGKSECGGGSGIYFMTDGVPNWAIQRAITARTYYPSANDPFTPPSLMNSALKGSSLSVTASGKTCTGSNLLPNVSGGRNTNDDGWTCIGDFAKKLNDENNPAGEAIRTATAGFGGTYKSMIGSKKINNPANLKDKDGNIIQVYNCNLLSGHQKNLCKLGEKGYGYGEGGAYFVKDGDGIVTSIVEFAQSLAINTDIKPISTGNFSVPLDPFGTKTKFDSYLPMLNPEIGKTSLWLGNVKKYKVRNGAVVGQNDNTVINPIKDDGTFAKNTKDYWNNTTATKDDGESGKGGVLSNIFKNYDSQGNATADKSKNLWVNTIVEKDGIKSEKLLKLQVDNDKKPIGFNQLDTDYTNTFKKQLLNFLGYQIAVNNNALESTNNADPNAELKPLNVIHDSDYKTHGAVFHSKPQLIPKKVEYIDGVLKKETRKDYMLYGSFDGSLRVIDDKTGKESFVFVPKNSLENQGSYLVPKDTTQPAKVRHGVDATWNIYTDYSTKSSKTSDNKLKIELTAKNIIASGGLRMGGSKYYALNLTDFDSPKLIYKIGSKYGPDGETTDATKSDFYRMGQTWGTPSVGYVKTDEKEVNGKTVAEKTMVHFLPGGYDLKYEKGDDLTAETTMGNAVYMVKIGKVEADLNTKTVKDGKNDVTVVTGDKGKKITTDSTSGTRLWWASSDATTTSTTTTNLPTKQATNNSDMKHSIVSSIIPIDRDYDGFTDHLYYADLNGKVFRADIDNSGKSFKVARVVKLLDVSNQKNASKDDKSSDRFYESPLVTFTRWKGKNDGGKYEGKIVGVVSLISGNRSRPLMERGQSDRVYTFIDYDIASNEDNFFANRNIAASGDKPAVSAYTKNTENLTLSNLEELKFTGFGDGSRETGSVKTKMTVEQVSGGLTQKVKQGWYYDLKYWNNSSSPVSNLKGFNTLNALEGYLFYTVFNPEPSTTPNSCSASIKGETQREVLCLPFGSCSPVARYKSVNAGKGLVENAIGPSFDPEPCVGKDCKDRKADGTKDGGIKVIQNTEKCKTAEAKKNPICWKYGKSDILRAKEWKER